VLFLLFTYRIALLGLSGLSDQDTWYVLYVKAWYVYPVRTVHPQSPTPANILSSILFNLLYEFTPPPPGRRGEITIAVAVDGIEV
jgi:hypothetical protein